MLQAVSNYFEKNKTRFEVSVEWYMESVKLDLEARGLIQRLPGPKARWAALDA